MVFVNYGSRHNKVHVTVMATVRWCWTGPM